MTKPNVIFIKRLNQHISFVVLDQKPQFNIKEVHQVHGAHVVHDMNITEQSKLAEADGICTHSLETPLAIKTADCLPIIVSGSKGIAILHAGWRGVHQEIVRNKRVSDLNPVSIFIGPHIQKDSFEVQPDFKSHFPNSKNFIHKSSKVFFDLASEVSEQAKASFPNVDIQVSTIDTYTDSMFHSFRKNQTSQRNWNLLVTNNQVELLNLTTQEN